MAIPTLLDIMVRNGSDAAVGLVDEAARQVPEITGRVTFRGEERVVPNLGAARTIKGRQYKTYVRTALPTAGFRHANAGTADVKSTYENRLVETFILNPRWKCDKAVADSAEDGAEAFIADEGIALTTAAMMALGKQFYYGAAGGGDAAGHPGLLDAVDASMVVDAGGTTASIASSVWAVKFGPQNVQWVMGEDGSLDLSDVRIESVVDPADSTKSFTAYVQELLAYCGVQVVNKFSVGRIKKLTTDTGKGLTDALLGDLLALFPVGYGPDCFFLTRRSLKQLRASRTATNATGAEAPTPTDYENIPLIPTDSLLDTEALTL